MDRSKADRGIFSAGIPDSRSKIRRTRYVPITRVEKSVVAFIVAFAGMYTVAVVATFAIDT